MSGTMVRCETPICSTFVRLGHGFCDKCKQYQKTRVRVGMVDGKNRVIQDRGRLARWFRRFRGRLAQW